MAIDPQDPGTLDLLASVAPAASRTAKPPPATSASSAEAALRAEVDRLRAENTALLERAQRAEAEAAALRARLAVSRRPLLPADDDADGVGGLLPTPQPRHLADLGNLLFALRGR